MSKKDLATLLLESNLIDEDQLREAKEVNVKAGLPLGKALVYLGYISQKDLIKMIATQLDLKFVDFDKFRIDRGALDLIPEDFARNYLVMPVTFDNGKLVIALTNPKDVVALKEVEAITGYEIEPAVSTKEDILWAIEKYYKEGTIEDELVGLLDESGSAKETKVANKNIAIQKIDLDNYQIDPNAVMTISEEMAKKNKIIPVGFDDNQLVVAMANSNDVFIVDNLRIATGYEIMPVEADAEAIEESIMRYYKMAEVVEVEEKLEDLVSEIGSEEELIKMKEIVEDAPIVKLVNLIVSRGVRDRASDIHIEPQEGDLRVRYRIDGVLHEVMKSPKRIQPGILSRFKIMASMDIAEKRKPQDGHTSMNIGGKAYDFRVATLPTIYGERIVLRVLAKESVLLDLEDLGFLEESLKRYTEAYTQPYGAILITGPTGSGKSTTLYATLNVLNTENKNIVTIEDPVEYRLPGINQIQINTKAGLTFSKGLRSILRTSPDILMVGEIRDRETAQIAIEAALTGHLVLSTLHTNDAPGAVSRLIEMGVEPFLVASSIDCVQAQRLARRLCKECKEEYEPSKKALEEIDFPFEGDKVPKFFRPKGCSKCNNTGYKGRVGIYEVMLMSEKIERLVIEKATTEQIKKVAMEEGMHTLRMDGFEKVALGVTSIEEVLRVVV